MIWRLLTRRLLWLRARVVLLLLLLLLLWELLLRMVESLRD